MLMISAARLVVRGAKAIMQHRGAEPSELLDLSDHVLRALSARDKQHQVHQLSEQVSTTPADTEQTDMDETFFPGTDASLVDTDLTSFADSGGSSEAFREAVGGAAEWLRELL
jgi:hypothetical protein